MPDRTAKSCLAGSPIARHAYTQNVNWMSCREKETPDRKEGECRTFECSNSTATSHEQIHTEAAVQIGYSGCGGGLWRCACGQARQQHARREERAKFGLLSGSVDQLQFSGNMNNKQHPHITGERGKEVLPNTHTHTHTK